MLNIPFIPSPLSTLVQLKKLHCAAVCACFTSLEHFILYTTIVHYHQVKPPFNLLLLIPTTGWCYFRSSSSLKCTKMAPRLFSSLLLFLSLPLINNYNNSIGKCNKNGTLHLLTDPSARPLSCGPHCRTRSPPMSWWPPSQNCYNSILAAH